MANEDIVEKNATELQKSEVDEKKNSESGKEIQDEAKPQDREQIECLLRIEEMMHQQLVQTVKMRRASNTRTIATIAIAVVFVISMVVFYNFVKQLTADIPRLITNANELVVRAGEDMDAALEKLESIDFDGINTVIADIAKINIDALNDSIEGLKVAVDNFVAFTEILKNPFGIGG